MHETKMWCGPNDGGIKRGDRADTGDLEARPTDGVTREGSGTGGATSAPESDDLTVKARDDATLGLTNIGNKPAEDWAADTGPTRTGEERERPTGRS